MTIRQKDLFISIFPLGLAFLAFLSLPSVIGQHHVRNISKALVIQTSKMDPPRIAFDEINQRSIATEVVKEPKGISLKSGAANLSPIPVQEILRTKKVRIPEMIFTENEVSQYLQEQRWMEELSPKEQQRLSVANESYGTLQEDWTQPNLQVAVQKTLQQIAQENPEVLKRIQEQRTENVVSGQIELRGLPSGPQWIVEISRYQDNIKKEDAKVNHKDSSFQIQVEDLSGTLQAKLKDTRSGQVLGEGSYRLSQDNRAKKTMVKITLEKPYDEVATTFHSFYQSSNALVADSRNIKKPVATEVLLASVNNEGKTDESGQYRFDQVKKGSWALLRTQGQNNYPSLFSVRSGTNHSQPLFAEKMILALKDIVKDQNVATEYAATGSVIWGQVLKNDKPVSGAQVEVENFSQHKAVYLNDFFIPDLKQTSTSSNGYFIILDLPAGFHSLLATMGSLYLSHSNVVVDEETLSITEMIVNETRNWTDIKVFDAFAGNPEAATVEMQSLPEALSVSGYSQAMLPAVERISFMNITPQDPRYLKTTMNYEDSQDYMHVPLIQASWVQTLLSQQKLNIAPDRGMIVGFVDVDNYEIYLGYDNHFPRENIVYFDARGIVSNKAVRGGGFLIVNVPLGPQSIVLAEGETEMLQMQLIDVNPEATSVIKF